MAAVATREHDIRHPESGSAEPPEWRLFEPAGLTLEDAILATWQELGTAQRAGCPVCAGELSREGRCTSCGSELS